MATQVKEFEERKKETESERKSDSKSDVKMKIVEVPEDNDCLFHCVLATCCDKAETVTSLRNLCGQLMESSQDVINFLALSEDKVKQRVKEIKTPKTWAGYEELILFSKYFEVEFVIVSEKVDDTIQRVKFPPEPIYTKRVYLYYCGVKKKENNQHQQTHIRTVHYNYFAATKFFQTTASSPTPLPPKVVELFHESIDKDETILRAIAGLLNRTLSEVPPEKAVKQGQKVQPPTSSPPKLPDLPKPVQTEFLYKCECCGAVLAPDLG